MNFFENEALLMLSAFLTSGFTAVAGIGGGVILILILPSFVSPEAIVPLHGVVQLFSNISRASFSAKNIRREYIFPFACGGVIGACCGSQFIGAISLELLPYILGCGIMAMIWLPVGKLAAKLPGRWYTVGGVQAFSSIFVGAAGPLSSTLLQIDNLKRDDYVVTGAALMSLMHLFKVAAFAFAGFQFATHLGLLAGMIGATTLGSYVGTQFRGRVPEAVFQKSLKWLLTALALRLFI